VQLLQQLLSSAFGQQGGEDLRTLLVLDQLEQEHLVRPLVAKWASVTIAYVFVVWHACKGGSRCCCFWVFARALANLREVCTLAHGVEDSPEHPCEQGGRREWRLDGKEL
jgi:hypothetical protein